MTNLGRVPERANHGTALRRARGYVSLTFRIYPEDGQFVSECLELDTASCGDSVEEALENIREATGQYLNAIEANGERERVFRKKNIPIYPVPPTAPRLVFARKRDFVTSVALPLAS